MFDIILLSDIYVYIMYIFIHNDILVYMYIMYSIIILQHSSATILFGIYSNLSFSLIIKRVFFFHQHAFKIIVRI